MTPESKGTAGPPSAGEARPPKSKPPLARPVIVVITSSLLALCALTIVALRLSRPAPELGGPGTAGPVRGAIGGGGATGTRPRSPEVDSRIFQVTEATGRVEARREGKWVLVVSGDVLTQDDVVRTGVGRAILRRGSTEIELRDRVEIRLDSISRAGTSVDLRRGRVVAHVGRAGGSVAITAARTRTENEGDAPARFVVTADERGRVAVATTEGLARFEAAGRTVKLAAGNAARAEPGRPPGDPERISEEIFLTVTWPAGDRKEDKVPVAGRTEPDATVRVNGVNAEVDRSGHFLASVPVRVGTNAVEVEVEDVSGRTRREKADVRKIPTRPPELAPVPTELWKK